MRVYIISNDGSTLCLEECHNADVGFQSASSTLTLRTALQALRFALWDSDLERLVPFRFTAAG